MTRKPKIKPSIGWAVISKEGRPVCIPVGAFDHKPAVAEFCQKRFGETVQRVLVCAPKGRKRHVKR